MPSIRTSLLALLLTGTSAQLAAATIAQFNTPFTEDFDTLASATSSVLPAGWFFIETGSSANATYGAGNGSSSTGNTYSFGSTSSTDRALGGVRTTGVASAFGTLLTNGTGGFITALSVAFTGEQWRLGALGRADRLDFGYSLDATSLATGNWVDVDALDFVAPITAGATGALDGNLAANHVLSSYTITGLNLPNSANIWLRWVDVDATGSDDGLAIDDVSISALQATAPNPGGGGAQNVPDSVPTSMIAVVLAALLASGSSRGTRVHLVRSAN
jgi:hypothetical protein